MALVLLDLDGTILKDGEIQEGIVEVIKKLISNKHKVAIATGRSPVFLSNYDKALGVDSMILTNGSIVKADGETIFEHSFPEHVIKKMMYLSDKMNFDLGLVYLDEYIAYKKDTENVDKFSETFKIIKPKLDKKFYPKRKILAMQIFSHDVVAFLREEMPELIFNFSNKYGYDVNLKGDMKADGARALMNYFQINREEIYAFGDGINDISMIKFAGYGIAMGNACKELKEVADYITDNVDDHGVIKALKHYKLI